MYAGTGGVGGHGARCAAADRADQAAASARISASNRSASASSPSRRSGRSPRSRSPHRGQRSAPVAGAPQLGQCRGSAYVTAEVSRERDSARRQGASSSTATHSTWCVIGNSANAAQADQRVAARRERTRGRGPGPPGRRRRRRCGAARSAAMPATAFLAPVRGGSSTTTSAALAERARAQRPLDRLAWTSVACGRSCRLRRASREPPGSPSTLSTGSFRPHGSSARNAVNSPTPGVEVEHACRRLGDGCAREDGVDQGRGRVGVHLPEARARRPGSRRAAPARRPRRVPPRTVPSRRDDTVDLGLDLVADASRRSRAAGRPSDDTIASTRVVVPRPAEDVRQVGVRDQAVARPG